METKTPFTLGEKNGEEALPLAAQMIEEVVAEPTEQLAKPNRGIEAIGPSTEEADGFWLSVDLPSNGYARYPAQIKVRKFTVPDLARLGSARRLNNYSMLVSAIGATIKGVDVRIITLGDFDFLIYWHAINSLLKTPITVTWRSRYGYKNETKVDATLRKTMFIEDGNAVKALQEKGYDFARIGDELWRQHAVDTNTFTDDNEVEFGLAKWAWVENPIKVEDKISKVCAMQDLEFYEGLDEWRTIANHGVTESTTLACKFFTPEKAIQDITHALTLLDASTVANGFYDEVVTTQTASLLEELAKLRRMDAAGDLSKATAEEEAVIIPLDVNNFFPVIL